MPTDPPASPGFLASFRALGDGLLATAQDRLELFSVELQEEKFRLIQIFFWISAAAFTGMMTITFASLTLVYFFWESARLAVLGGLTAFYAVALAGLIVGYRRFVARLPSPFLASRQELREDRACIPKEN
ncbi:MAG: phage holin family protein [Opitutae bacterium]|nr:phage holin family protein [Opitutae bacterium]